MLELDAPAAARRLGTAADRTTAGQEFADFAALRGYLSVPSAVAFAEWLASAWDDFVESDGSLSTRFVVHSALVDWCGGTDPAVCLHGYSLSETCPDCTAAEQTGGAEPDPRS